MFFVAKIYELLIFTDLIPVILAPFLLIIASLFRSCGQEATGETASNRD